MEDVKPMMQEALARRRGKYSQPDEMHKDNMASVNGMPVSGHATEGAQNEYEEKVNQGKGTEAPAGKSPVGATGGLKDNGGGPEGMNSGVVNGNTDAANKIAHEVSEAELITQALGSSNAPGLRGRVMQDARGKLDNMKAMQTK